MRQLIKRYLFQFQFALCVCFYGMAEREMNQLPVTDCVSLRNFCQIRTPQHTANVNELFTKALPGSR